MDIALCISDPVGCQSGTDVLALLYSTMPPTVGTMSKLGINLKVCDIWYD